MQLAQLTEKQPDLLCSSRSGSLNRVDSGKYKKQWRWHKGEVGKAGRWKAWQPKTVLNLLSNHALRLCYAAPPVRMFSSSFFIKVQCRRRFSTQDEPLQKK